MAASYWQSTQHRRWEDSTAEASDKARNDEEEAFFARYPLPEPRLLHGFLQKRLHQLAKKINVRQIVSATAMVFVRRFYQRVQIRHTNPYLVLATALYVACKIEECPQHIKAIITEARSLWPAFIQADPAKLGECEFRLISELNAQLIIHHPYRPLAVLQEQIRLSDQDMATAWRVVNDHYLTDLPFRYPPHIIALAAVVLSMVPDPGRNDSDSIPGSSSTTQQASADSVFSEVGKKLRAWLVDGDIDAEGVMDCVQHMISLYVLLDRSPQYEEKCKEQIAHFWKGQHLESWAGGM